MIKEQHLRGALMQFENLKLIFNKQIDGGCSKNRPDVRIELLTHTIIIECDEEQHKQYSCENKRVMEIFQDLGNRPLIIIRFNPDSYVDGSGKKNYGCFSTTKTGSLSLNQKEWDRRTKLLADRINESHNIPEREVTLENMFYDDYN